MVLQWCLWGLAAYGVTCLLLVLLQKWNWVRIYPRKIHVIVLSYNSQHTIEWTIRSMNMWSWLEGKAYEFTVIDAGSNDDTKFILSRLSEGHQNIRLIETDLVEMDEKADYVISMTDREKQRVIMMDLRRNSNIRNQAAENAYSQ